MQILGALRWRAPIFADDAEPDHGPLFHAGAKLGRCWYAPAVRRSTPTLALTAALLLAGITGMSACKKSGSSGGTTSPRGSKADDAEPFYGYEDASSDDIAAIPPALASDDIEGIQARGLTLWRMQRAMRMGDRTFIESVGVTSARFQALATVDGGGKSGEVAFYRWDEDTVKGGVIKAEDARRWIVVSVTFDPDEHLEPQKLDTEPDGEQRRTLAAVLVAQQRAKADYPQARWVAYTFREQQMQAGAPTGLRQTRVYMIGADDKSPDIEYTVLDPSKRRQPPEIIETVEHLTGDATSKLPLTTSAASPGSCTIARAVAIATVTEQPVEIVDGSGSSWTVAPKSGAVKRK
jgi:hypothetical protein